MAVAPGACSVVVLSDETLRGEVLTQTLRRRGLDAHHVPLGGASTGDEVPPTTDAVLVCLADPEREREHGLAHARTLADAGATVLRLMEPGAAAEPWPGGLADVDVVSTRDTPDDLVDALLGRRASRGRPSAAGASSRGARLDELTDREREVLGQLLTGDATDAIAGRLGISPHTVRTHVQNLLSKLGVNSRVEAAAVAIAAGVATPAEVAS